MLLGAVVLLTACGKEEAQEAAPEPVRPVKTVVVADGVGGGVRTFPGRVDAARQVELSFSVPGKLEEFPVREGQQVKEGDTVARLDPTNYRTTVNDEQAKFDKAKADFARAQELIKKDFISRQDYDTLESKLRSATAALERAKTDLGYTVLKAPFEGRIAQRYVENFTEVQAKEPVLALQDIDTLEVKFQVPENIMRLTRRGNAEQRPPEEQIKVTARFDGAGDTVFPLEFKEVATRADPDTQTFQATFTLPAPEGFTLLPGMTGSVDVDMSTMVTASSSFALPVSAVVGDTTKTPTVWVVEEGSMTVSPHPVEVGSMTGNSIIVQSGLEPGDRVVVAGVSFLREGMKVRLMEDKEQAVQ
jgi:RND family efflux transporter MFP subunit